MIPLPSPWLRRLLPPAAGARLDPDDFLRGLPPTAPPAERSPGVDGPSSMTGSSTTLLQNGRGGWKKGRTVANHAVCAFRRSPLASPRESLDDAKRDRDACALAAKGPASIYPIGSVRREGSE